MCEQGTVAGSLPNISLLKSRQAEQSLRLDNVPIDDELRISFMKTEHQHVSNFLRCYSVARCLCRVHFFFF
jgi:hypothetical protein